MSNEVEKTAKGLKGLLKGRKSKNAEPEQAAEQAERAPEKAKAKAQTAAAPESTADQFIVKPPEDGNLIKLWELWANYAHRPEPSFACGGREAELFESERNLIMESRLIMARIEQDAQRTLRLIEQLQKMAESGETRCLDASCFVYRSKNAMAAWVMLLPPWGLEGKIPENLVESALQTNGIVYGIDTERLAQLKEKPVYLTPVPVAFGTPVVPGQNGKIIEHFPRQLPKKISVDENGIADYRISNFVQVVNEGDVICDIIAPVAGVAGTTVEGKTVEPPPVKPAKVPSGPNTAVNADGTKLLASISGHMEFAGNGFTIKAVLSVNGDVDFSVGNINMRGDVHIRGDVREGFSVKATGNIIVEGVVASANVEAGGDVIVVRGIVGNNNSLTKAGGQVRAKFMENCIVYAGEGVAAECILSSTVYSDGTIESLNGRGTIIGGTLTAARSIKARVIGSEFGTITKIILGTYGNVHRQLSELNDEIAATEKELREIEKNLNYFSMDPNPANESKIANARLRKSILLMQHQKQLDRKAEFESMTPDLALCKVDAKTIHQQTTVTVGRYSWCAEEQIDNCVLIYDTSSCEVVQV